MRITQLRTSAHVRFFAEGFASRWGLNPDIANYDPTQPCVFLGCYSEEDARFIRFNSSPLKVVIPTGEGSRMDLLYGTPGLVFISPDQQWANFGGSPDADRLPLPIPIKDFRAYTPEVMGDKVYVYIGNGDRKKFRLDQLDRVMDAIGHDRFILGEGLKLSASELIERYYRPSCVNLQINPDAGFTSSVEMAYMGRPTIGNFETPWNRPYRDEAELIKTIEWALRTLPGQFAGRCVPPGYFHESDDWLQTEYYQR